MKECDLDIPILNYFLKSTQQIELRDKYLAVNPADIIRLNAILLKE